MSACALALLLVAGYILGISAPAQAATCELSQGTDFTTATELTALLATSACTADGDQEIVVFNAPMTFNLTLSNDYIHWANNADLVLRGEGDISPVIDAHAGTFVEDISASSKLYVENLTVENGAHDSGMGILFAMGDASISNSQILHNSSGLGGALFVYGNLELSSAIVAFNSSEFDGGAMYVEGNATIISSTFSSNSSGIVGGAGFIQGSLDLRDSTFYDNQALSEGAAMYTKGDMAVTRSAFFSNVATSGGVLEVDPVNPSATTTISNSTFAYNSSSIRINKAGTAKLVFNTFYQNGLPNSGIDYDYGRSMTTRYGPLDSLTLVGNVMFEGTAGAQACLFRDPGGIPTLVGMQYNIFRTDDRSCGADTLTERYVTTEQLGWSSEGQADVDGTYLWLPTVLAGSPIINGVPATVGMEALTCLVGQCVDEFGVIRDGSAFWTGSFQQATPLPDTSSRLRLSELRLWVLIGFGLAGLGAMLTVVISRWRKSQVDS